MLYNMLCKLKKLIGNFLQILLVIIKKKNLNLNKEFKELLTKSTKGCLTWK